MPRSEFWIYFFGAIVVSFAATWLSVGTFTTEPARPAATEATLSTAVSTASNDDTAPSETSSESVAPEDQSDASWSNGRNGAAENADEHWRKHGGDFSNLGSEKQYEHAANDFVDHPPPGTLSKRRRNGDTLFYNPETNTFAVANSRGKPRTFFKPNSGRDYWDRQ